VHLSLAMGVGAQWGKTRLFMASEGSKNAAGLSVEAGNLLWYWGLTIDLELKILICHTCGQGITSSPCEIISHLQNNHCKKGSTIAKGHPNLLSRFTEAIRYFPFTDPKQVRDQPNGRAPIHGIHIYAGYYHPEEVSPNIPCSVVFQASSSSMQHMKSHVKEDQKNQAKFRGIPATVRQSLSTNQKNTSES